MRKKKKKPVPAHILRPQPTADFCSVKTSLKSILKDYDGNFPIINNLVTQSQEIVVQTYLFIRLFLLSKYHQGQEFPDIDTSFILYCIRTLGERDNRGRKARNKELQRELAEFYEREFSPCLNKPKFSLLNKTYLIPYLATQIQTGFHNNLKMHFITRCRRFLNIFMPTEPLPPNLTKKEEKRLSNRVKNAILNDNIIEKCPLEFQEWALKFRQQYLPEEYKIAFAYDVKCQPQKYLRSTIKMNEEIERFNQTLANKIAQTDKEKKITELQCQLKKLFQPIPLRTSVIPAYTTIDTNVILSTFGKRGEKQLNKQTTDKFRFIWSKVFKIDKKIFQKKGYHFTSIQTDGVGVSILFQKNNLKRKTKPDVAISPDIYLDELCNQELKILQKRKVVVVDPGKQVLVQMLAEDNQKLRYTASQRRMESLSKRNRNILRRQKQQAGIQELESELSEQNAKTVDYEKFQQYITEKIKLNDQIKDFYQGKLLRKLKWRTQIYRRKSEDKFLNRIEKTFGKQKEIIICYGDWSNNRQMKYIMPTMGIGLRKLIGKRFDVALINENNTSKLCHHCYGELEHWQNKHRLLFCRECSGSESKKSRFMNRDVNACHNLITISRDWLDQKLRRPEFCLTYNKFNNDLTDNKSVKRKHC